MMLRFRAEAGEEFAEAVRQYNQERPGLGFEFAGEVRNALNRMKKYPDSWPLISPNIRKCIVNRFPFAVLYKRGSEHLLVVAVMHMKRNPWYWRKRLD